MTRPLPQLEYAGQAPWHRRRATRRVAIVLAGLLIALSLWRFGPEIIRRGQTYYWQRKAMRYAPADGTVAFTADETVRAKCMALGNLYISKNQYDAALIVEPWKNFYAHYSPPGGNASAAFCHALTSPSGNTRLVVVALSDQVNFARSAIVMSPIVFVPGSFLSEPRQILTRGTVANGWGWSATVYMGKVDPADASHFTIEVAVRGRLQIFDGYLKDDDTVTLDERIETSAVSSAPLPADTKPSSSSLPAENPPEKKRKKRKAK